MGIEKRKKGVSRLYARTVPNAGAEHLGAFMGDHMDKKANVATDQWTGHAPLEKDFGNLVRTPSGKKGCNFPEMHRAVMNPGHGRGGRTTTWGTYGTIWTNIATGSTGAS